MKKNTNVEEEKFISVAHKKQHKSKAHSIKK